MSLGPLSFLAWAAVVGVLLLVMALSSAYLRRLPVSTSTIYLALGVAVSPIGLGWMHVEVRAAAPWFERLTEVAVVLSLFVGGLKLRLSPRDASWSAAYRLAGPVMLASIAGVAVVAHVVLGLDTSTALLIGAVLAPTDPVLASSVSVNDARDRDRMRYALSGEAGLNDGMAFPFVVFALAWREHGGTGTWIVEWALHRVLWAIPAGLVFGHLVGHHLGRVAMAIRHRQRDTSAPSDFLALAIVALSYVGAEVIGAWGFLAVFAAGVGLRRAEAAVVAAAPHPDAAKGDDHPPAEHLVGPNVEADALEQPAVAAGVIVAETVSFGDTVERMLEVLLVVIVGVALPTHFDARSLVVAAALLVVIRPAAAFLLLARTPTSVAQRGLLGWFGIRGIGSLYYLTYAFRNGVDGAAAEAAAAVTVTVIAVSVVAHGVSAQPILGWYERSLRRGARHRPAARSPVV